jgi:hypothetical protein
MYGRIYSRRELDLLLHALYHLVSVTLRRSRRLLGFRRSIELRRHVGLAVQFLASLPINRHSYRMRRLIPLSYRTSKIALIASIAFVCAQSNVVSATNVPAEPGAPQTLTQYEYFIQTQCIPCVREFYIIATLPFPSVKTPDFAGLAPANPAPNTRAGEMRLELLRAYPLGQKSRQHMAMRVVLSVSAGSGNTLYPLGAGLLDEDEVPVLAAALSQMGKSMSAAGDDSSIQLVDTEFHAGSVRMGTVRSANDFLAYVQIAPADPQFALKQLWELPAMYLPSKDIPTLEHAVLQVNAKILTLRGR